MRLITTHQVKHLGRSIGVIGLSISLMGFPATCTGPNQGLFSSMRDTDLAVHDESGQANTVSKPKTWTVYCEREDGAKSKFTVSSELSEQISASLKEHSTTDTKTEPSPAEKTISDDKEVVLDNPEADPFGDSTVKCGKLLTLLAIFATVHKQHQ